MVIRLMGGSPFSEGHPMWNFIYLVAEADQLAAQARDARCCDALDPCQECRRLRRGVVVRRYLVRSFDAGTAA